MVTEWRTNFQLKNVPQIRLVGDNVQMGLYSYDDAIKLAQNLELDLIEISKQDSISVCKIMDFQKFLYQKKQKEKELKQNCKKQELKEIRLSPTTSEHDLEFKIKHAKNFLKEGNRVKFTVQFTGREIMHKEQGITLLQKIEEELENIGIIDSSMKLENKRLFCIFKPKSNGKTH